MEFSVRPAHANDADAITAFTTDTFEWGDYIPTVFPQWLDDPNGLLAVGVDRDDQPIAIGRGAMMSKTEAWLQGFRVNPEWRRLGVASALVETLVDWATDRGALIARLLTEGWNEPAQRQVEKGGFRRSSSWIVGEQPVDDVDPATAHNGGRRAKARRKLGIVHSSEAIPAWASWRSGPLIRPARGLHADGWRWSQLSAERLQQMAKQGRLWASQAGWALTRRNDEAMYVDWLECGPDSIDDMLKSIMDLAVESDAQLLRITIPDVAWLIAALKRAGYETSLMYLYERAL